MVVVLWACSLGSAQTVRNVSALAVFATYQENRTHWTDPAVSGANLIAQANSFWHGSGASWGAITITGTTLPTWVDSTGSMAAGCNLGPVWRDVIRALPIGNTANLIIIVLPPGTPCYSESAGILGTIFLNGGSSVEHEVGHYLGLAHAADTRCNASGCSTYGIGLGDLMGSGGVLINAVERAQLGLFSPTFQKLEVTDSQDVVLQTINSMTPGIKAITATPPAGPAHAITAELHAGDFAAYGVTLHGPPNNYQLDLDRMTDGLRVLMHLGETYCDPGYVCVTLLAKDPATQTATLHVDMSGTVVTPPPPPDPMTITLVSPASGVSYPISQTAAPNGPGFHAVVTATSAAKVRANFGPSGATSTFLCGAAPTAYYACVIANGTYTFTLKTGLSAGPRVLWFDAMDTAGKTVSTPKITVLVTP